MSKTGAVKLVSAIGILAVCVGAAAQMDSAQLVAYAPGVQTMPGESQQQTQIPRPTASQPTLNNDPNAGDSAEVTGQMMIDKVFLRKVAENSLAEAKLGELAIKNSSTDAVKQFGQRMVDDQQRLDAMFAPIAQNLRIKVPTKLSRKDQAELAKLQGLSGSEFDQEYVRYSLAHHVTDDKEFTTELQVATDPALVSAVSTGQKIVHRRLLRIQKVAKDENISVDQPVAAAQPR